MDLDLLKKCKKLLAEDPNEHEKFVLIDVKWFNYWLRFAESKEEDKNLSPPGPIDFTNLIDPETKDDLDGVQLRRDAVEGNDFTFVPYEIYEKLKGKYDKIGKEIVREVIPIQTGDYRMTIETFFVPLRICRNRSSTSKAEQIYRSRRTKLSTLKKQICDRFSLACYPADRLMASTDTMGNSWEEVKIDENSVLADASLVKNAFLTCESRSIILAPTNVTLPSNTLYKPGLCGLSNLGNTCFMNSALQCLSNVPELSEYFYRKDYEEHINHDNPLGMKGDVARAYGELIADMWSGRTNYCAPKSLKYSVSRYAPQFSGYNQQDSQEFMSFLLDGLHEDLNLVKKKPYVEKKEDDGKMSDQELAKEHWEYYLARNRSKIQEIFHGQIRSEVHCLTCNQSARTFDPICFLSLPLPEYKKTKTYKIDYVTVDGRVRTYFIKSNENGRIKDLISDFCRYFQKRTDGNDKPSPMDPVLEINDGSDQEDTDTLNEEDKLIDDPPKPDRIMATEIFNHRIYTQYREDSYLTQIRETDHVVFYQTHHSLHDDRDERILMPVTFRSRTSYRNNFGLPIYLSVPRKNCKGRDIEQALENAIVKFLPLKQTNNSEKALYTPSLTITNVYNPETKTLASMLDANIDFNKMNVSLMVDVDDDIVAKYESAERKANAALLEKQNKKARVKTDKGITLADCFKHFTTKETLSDDDLWFCPKCKELKKATKKMDLWRLPQVLIIQLKRFNYTRYWRDKIDLYIDCPITGLDLSPYLRNTDEKSNCIYDLIAISNHMGSLGGGHYTAYAKNIGDNQWHSFDDGFVSGVDEDRLISKSAYVLIYKRRQPQNKRPGSSRQAASNK